MKRISSLICVLLLTNVPISCIEDDCGSFTLLEARITELSSSVGTITSTDFSDLKSTNWDESAIQIAISDMHYSEISAATKNTEFSFINSAYACSPPEPAPTQAIESITVTSESSIFSQGIEYSTGKNLVELFKVSRYSYATEAIPVTDFIGRQKNELWIFGYVGANVVFQFKNQPDSTINQSFVFEFEFSDLEKISIQTPTFEVD